MTYTFSKEAVKLLISKIKALVSSHTSNTSNPHGVTKAQVGLGNVANTDQSKAIKSITRSGTTFTATALDGTTSTFTQQDSNTTYGPATTSSNGLMSSSDKQKLDGIASRANNYSLPTASASTLGGVKVGSNLSISNGVLSGTPNTTYSEATSSAAGLMSAADKQKLNGVTAGANAIIKYETHAVSTSGWTAKTIDGVSYKAYAVTLTYTFDPMTVTVSLCASGNRELPTDAEAKAYGAPICTLNGRTLYVCKSTVPNTAFTILVGGKIA